MLIPLFQDSGNINEMKTECKSQRLEQSAVKGFILGKTCLSYS